MVYFNISPLFLVLFTVVFYLIFTLCKYIFARHAKTAVRCSGKIFANGKEIQVNGLLDSGNSVVDVFGNSEIIIVEKQSALRLFGETDISLNPDLARRFRPIPLCTLSGTEILDGFRCDKAEFWEGDKKINLEKPIIAVSNQSFKEDYNAILNPQVFS